MNRFTMIKQTCVGFILVLIVCAVACLPSGNVAPPQLTAPAVVPAAPAAPVQDASKSSVLKPGQEVIFQDDFKDSSSGWTVFSNDFGEGKYENGGYFLKSNRPSYHGATASTTTTNAGLTSLTGFMLDLDVTMLSGSRYDYFEILLKWPDINPLGIEGYEQPSDYYFFVAPEGMLAWCYSKQEIKGSSVDKIMPLGYFLRPSQFTCVRGKNLVNNIKIWFNPHIRFLVNDYELVNATDRNLDYANRLIKDGAMAGATVQLVADGEDVYSRPVFQLNKITVANIE